VGDGVELICGAGYNLEKAETAASSALVPPGSLTRCIPPATHSPRWLSPCWRPWPLLAGSLKAEAHHEGNESIAKPISATAPAAAPLRRTVPGTGLCRRGGFQQHMPAQPQYHQQQHQHLGSRSRVYRPGFNRGGGRGVGSGAGSRGRGGWLN
jgi:hypothetical protein